jgi:hypothetical protein
LKQTNSITHDNFIVGYQNGRLGCSVSVLRVLSLVYSGKIREKHIVRRVIAWSAALLAVICLWVVGLFSLPVLWAFLAGAIILATFIVVSLHGISEGVLSVALIDGEFYELIRTEHALTVATDEERNLPRLHKVVPMRDPRRARRR